MKLLFWVPLLVVPVLAAPSAVGDIAAQDLTAIEKRNLASTILSDIESAVDCAGCDVVLLALKGLAKLGDDDFVAVITELCDLSGAEDPDVCAGVVAAEGPILAQDIRQISIGSHTSQLFCITLLGLCAFPEVTKNTISFPSAKPNTSRPSPSGKNPLQVVHISDTHVDLNYTIGANYNCTKPICCRPYTSADNPGNNDFPAGPFGNPNCDPPLTLEQSMFESIEALSPAFTIFTGDVVAHDVWLVNEAEVDSCLDTTYSAMKSIGTVYPAVGNHDVAPFNSFPPTALPQADSVQWAYDKMSSDWSTWIGATATSSADKYGSYSIIHPGSNLKVISFNSIFYYTLNFWMYTEPLESDPSGQFAWLVSELQAAETASQRVWLIAHIPSGSSDYLRDYSNPFDQIVNRYDATIAALFYGHTHVDQFEISYSDYNHQTYENAVAMSYITPSMTPTSGSPSYRVYTVDPETFGVLDFTDYIADINAPTLSWSKYYSAKEVYGPIVSPPLTDPAAELTPAFWHNVTAAFETNDAAFQAYYQRKSRGFDTSTCTGDCKTDEICELRAANSEYNCATISPGIHFSKRDVRFGEHKNECEGGQIRGIFQAIAGERREEFVQTVVMKTKERAKRKL